MISDPADLSIAEAGAALRSRTLTAVELLEAHLGRIDRRNPVIGAFVHVDRDRAMASARAADQALSAGEDLGPLMGIPFAVKDVIDVEGWPVRWGSRLYAHRRATQTARVVSDLLDAGAVPLGLVATYELATVGPDRTGLYPQPLNPWDHDRITGGSSSGSAAAVAAGMVRLALGTDTGGSARSPASYCGVVGWKPGRDVLPRNGIMELSPTLDHVGLVARTAGDAAAVFGVLHPVAARCSTSLAGLRLAYGRIWAIDPKAHATLLPTLDDAAAMLSLLGASIDLVDFPDYDEAEGAGLAIILAEGHEVHSKAVGADPSLAGDMARASILSGASVDADRRADAHARAEKLRTAFDAILLDHDALILPTTLGPAPRFLDFEPGKPLWTPMRTIPFNLTGHPAISVPMGFAEVMPLGLQIVGRRGGDAMVLSIATAFEAATDHTILQPAFA